MAFTGHSGMHTAQSMHSSGSIDRKFGPSRKQSTGQTSTQSVYLHLMHDSVTTCVIEQLLSFPFSAAHEGKCACGKVGILADAAPRAARFPLWKVRMTTRRDILLIGAA